MGSAAIAVFVAGLLGLSLAYLGWNSALATCVAACAGWAIGSLVAAAAWLRNPPDGVEILAVSFGAREAVVSTSVVVLVGLLVHFAVAKALGDMSPWLVSRVAIACLIGALIGALAFGSGAAVRGVR